MTRRRTPTEQHALPPIRGPQLRVAPKRMQPTDPPGNVHAMASIQVKHVPDDVHQILRDRAASAGKSLQEYLLARLTEEARTPTVNEVLDRVAAMAGDRHPTISAADAIRLDREAR